MYHSCFSFTIPIGQGNIKCIISFLFCKIDDRLALLFRVFDGFIGTAKIPEQIGNQAIGSVHHPSVSLLNRGFVVNSARLLWNNDFIIVVFVVFLFRIQLIGYIGKAIFDLYNQHIQSSNFLLAHDLQSKHHRQFSYMKNHWNKMVSRAVKTTRLIFKHIRNENHAPIQKAVKQTLLQTLYRLSV